MNGSSIACEPNANLAQRVDIEVLRKAADKELCSKQAHLATNELKKKQGPSTKNEPNFIILPIYSYEEHLKDVLSLNKNEYLRMKWNKFIERPPNHWVQIKLCRELNTPPGERIYSMPVPRRKTLNGKFYGPDNLLAPIPFVPPKNSKD